MRGIETDNPAILARRAYKREWYANNRDQQREYQKKYWERRGREYLEKLQAGEITETAAPKAKKKRK